MLVNNTNVANDTTTELLVEGQAIVEEAAAKLNLLVGQIGILENLIDTLPKQFREKYKGIITPIKLYMRKDWMD